MEPHPDDDDDAHVHADSVHVDVGGQGPNNIGGDHVHDAVQSDGSSSASSDEGSSSASSDEDSSESSDEDYSDISDANSPTSILEQHTSEISGSSEISVGVNSPYDPARYPQVDLAPIEPGSTSEATASGPADADTASDGPMDSLEGEVVLIESAPDVGTALAADVDTAISAGSNSHKNGDEVGVSASTARVSKRSVEGDKKPTSPADADTASTGSMDSLEQLILEVVESETAVGTAPASGVDTAIAAGSNSHKNGDEVGVSASTARGSKRNADGDKKPKSPGA